MVVNSKEDIIYLIEQDKWMMDLLNCVKPLDLPDWWICAGFVRSKIWDEIHDFNDRTAIPDIDVIYYDKYNCNVSEEKKLEEILKEQRANIPWSVKNQARMHIVNNIPPYTSAIDAISKFPETATALGVKLDEKGNVIISAPHEVHDVINLKVKPTPFFLESEERMQTYEKRIEKKGWMSTWNKVQLFNSK